MRNSGPSSELATQAARLATARRGTCRDDDIRDEEEGHQGTEREHDPADRVARLTLEDQHADGQPARRHDDVEEPDDGSRTDGEPDDRRDHGRQERPMAVIRERPGPAFIGCRPRSHRSTDRRGDGRADGRVEVGGQGRQVDLVPKPVARSRWPSVPHRIARDRSVDRRPLDPSAQRHGRGRRRPVSRGRRRRCRRR